MKIYPPLRYGIVQPGLHRGSHPKPRHEAFLATLNLKTIISIVPDEPTPELHEFMRNHAIQHVWVPCPKPKEGNIGLTSQAVNFVVNIMLDWSRYPLYVHCLDGTVATGIVVMCLRKLIGWNEASIMAEFVRLSKDQELKKVEQEEVDCLSRFGKVHGIPASVSTANGLRMDESGDALPASVSISNWSSIPPWLNLAWQELGLVKDNVTVGKHPLVGKIRYPDSELAEVTPPTSIVQRNLKTLEDLIVESRTLSALALETGSASQLDMPFIVEIK